MRRFVFVVIAASLVGAFLFPTTALAGRTKVGVCHSEGNGSFHLINISEKAVAKHIAKHGDGLPGQAVPGMDGHKFSDDCVPELDFCLASAIRAVTPAEDAYSLLAVRTTGNDSWSAYVEGPPGPLQVGIPSEWLPNTFEVKVGVGDTADLVRTVFSRSMYIDCGRFIDLGEFF